MAMVRFYISLKDYEWRVYYWMKTPEHWCPPRIVPSLSVFLPERPSKTHTSCRKMKLSIEEHFWPVGGSSADTPHGHFGGLILDDLGEWGAPQQQSFCATSTNWSNWNSVRTPHTMMSCKIMLSTSFDVMTPRRGVRHSLTLHNVTPHARSHLQGPLQWKLQKLHFSTWQPWPLTYDLWPSNLT